MDRFSEVSAALQPYFDGLYESNTRKLTLVHVDGRWQIMAKVFHYDE